MAATWDIWRDDTTNWEDRHFFRDILRLYGGPVLDVGCGTGRIAALPVSAHELRGRSFSPDGKRLATGEWIGDISIWDVKTHKLEARFRAHSNGVSCVAFSHDGRTLASGGIEGRIILWNIATQHEVGSFTVEAAVNSIAFSKDGRRLAASSNAGRTLRIWTVLIPGESPCPAGQH